MFEIEKVVERRRHEYLAVSTLIFILFDLCVSFYRELLILDSVLEEQ